MKVYQPSEDSEHGGMDIIRVIVELSNGEVLDLTPILDKPRRLRVTTVNEEGVKGWETYDILVACRAMSFEEFPAPYTRLCVTQAEEAVKG